MEGADSMAPGTRPFRFAPTKVVVAAAQQPVTGGGGAAIFQYIWSTLVHCFAARRTPPPRPIIPCRRQRDPPGATHTTPAEAPASTDRRHRKHTAVIHLQ